MRLLSVFLFKAVNPCQTIKFDCLASELSLFVETHPAGPVPAWSTSSMAEFEWEINVLSVLSNACNICFSPPLKFQVELRISAPCLSKMIEKTSYDTETSSRTGSVKGLFSKESVSGMFGLCRPECDLIVWQSSLLSVGYEAKHNANFFPSRSSHIQSLQQFARNVSQWCWDKKWSTQMQDFTRVFLTWYSTIVSDAHTATLPLVQTLTLLLFFYFKLVHVHSCQ